MYGFTVNCDGNSIAQLKAIEAELGKAGIKAKVTVGEIESSFVGMGEKIKGVFSELKGIVAGGFLAGGIFGGYEFIKKSKEAYDNLEKSVTRVNTVLASTKYAAGLSGEDIEAQAKSLSKHIVTGRADIMDAQGMLLSFTGIKGPVFGEATKAVADFATFYKTDMTSAALTIGKALNDPARGMNRLQRQGVAFTEEQKKQIVNYEKQGQLAKAQAVILKELHTEFGGQAEAYAKTDEGKLAMDAKGWGTLKLEIGEIISKIQLELLPVFADVRNFVKTAFESAPVQFFIEHIRDLLSIGMRILPVWITYKGVLGALALETNAVALAQTLFGTATKVTTAEVAVQKVVVSGFMGTMQATTAATEEATVATSAFGAAWGAIGIGAVAIAIGLLVENLIGMNTELDEAIDKKYKLSENNDFASAQAHKFTKIQGLLSQVNNPNMNIGDKRQLYLEMQNYVHEGNLQKNLLKEDIDKVKKNVIHSGKMYTGETQHKYEGEVQGYHDLIRTVPQVAYQLNILTKENDKLIAYNKLHPNHKKDLIIPNSYRGGSATDENATNTSQLAGARGGLGEAKVINIHIDTVQKIDGILPEGIKNNAQSAIEILIRTINNMAYSQSGTM